MSHLATGTRRTALQGALAITGVFAVAAVHALRLGAHLHGSLFRLYYSYASDILVPFAMYFLLVLSERSVPFLHRWWVKSTLVFSVAAATEILQALGLPILGRTFDPLDFVMFGVGVVLAAGLDESVLWLTTRSGRDRAARR